MTVERFAAELRRRYAQPPEKLFDAFANASLVSQWLKPAIGIELVVERFEFRALGSYRFAYHLADGGVMRVGGIFQLIEPPSRLSFSWIIEPPDEHAGIDSLVVVDIVPDGDGCELLIRHEKLVLPDAIARHADGWRGAATLLALLLEEPRDDA